MFRYMHDFKKLETIETAIECYNGMVDSLKFYELEKIMPSKYEGYNQIQGNEKLDFIEDICYNTLHDNTEEISRTEIPFWDDEKEVLKILAELQKILRVTRSLFYDDKTWECYKE